MAEEARDTGTLSELLSDPRLMQTLEGVLGSRTASEKTSEESAPLADGLAGVLSNPALMAKLPAVIAMLRPILQDGTSGTPPENTPNPPSEKKTEKDGTLPTLAAPAEHRSDPQEKCRKELLIALKPFLSKERCAAVDMILRLSTLSTVLKHLN